MKSIDICERDISEEGFENLSEINFEELAESLDEGDFAGVMLAYGSPGCW